MNKKIVSLNIQGDKGILVETLLESKEKNDEKIDRVRMDRPDYLKQKRDFGEAVEVIKPIAEKIITPLLSLKEQPSEIEVEFSFRFNNYSEVILTTKESDANVTVKLKWNQKAIDNKSDFQE